ncbi:hypothetical protein U0027_24035 (plasmid) [Agrobacterium tumefaciens]|uniref:hypothetical protein n=1 Tax=Agrobacterium tumefaciens TaxID=358 RepID=UPI0013B3B643|nr:hypothetical protein [Agrobacterium tumefaciens]WQE43491.1 hypothetical protein U0027_24035 [Agrobacterium tumefaciens]
MPEEFNRQNLPDQPPEVERDEAWSSLQAAMTRGVSDDFMEGGREQRKPQDRPEP